MRQRQQHNAMSAAQRCGVMSLEDDMELRERCACTWIAFGDTMPYTRLGRICVPKAIVKVHPLREPTC